MQPDMPLGRAFLCAACLDENRLPVTHLHRVMVSHERAKLCHLGKNHRHHLKRIGLIGGKVPGVFGLNHQNAKVLAKALDRHATERGINLFPGLRHIAEPFGLGRVGSVDDMR